MSRGLPYLTSAPVLAGVFKARWEDFVVEEMPGPPPAGHGDHTWFEIEKHGLVTHRAAADIAAALGVKAQEMGWSGIKDARAVARQWLSVEHVDPERLLELEIPRIRVLRAERHPRKLRRGWHAGNRFTIRIRAKSYDVGAFPGAAPEGDEPGKSYDVLGSSAGVPALPALPALPAPPAPPASPDPPDPPDAPDPPVHLVRTALEALARRGVPNYYGPQRFGSRGDTWRVGRALARERWEEAASLIAGRPLRKGDPEVDPSAGVHADTGDVLRARELYDAGEYASAAGAWPRGFAQCARLCQAMDRTGGDAAKALRVVGKRMLRLYASAYQSHLFNAVLGARLEADAMDRLLAGDLAWKHDTEALFEVSDVAAEQPRADRFEISPTGPLVGKRPRTAAGDAGELERRALAAAGWDAAELESRAMSPLKGRRRPLRFPLSDPAAEPGRDDEGDYVELRFALPPGCYATSVLRELGHGGIVEGG